MAITLPITSRTSSDDNDFADVYANDTQLVTEIDDRDSTYRLLGQAASVVTSGFTAGTYWVSSSPLSGSGAVGAGVPKSGVYLDDADFSITSKSLRLRLRAQLASGATAPSGTFTVGLYPVSVASGNYSFGTVTSGSTVALSGTLNTIAQGNSGDFSFPGDGFYAFGVVLSATAGQNADLFAQLQVQLV